MWNSRSGWKKYQEKIVGMVGIVVGEGRGLEKSENFDSRGGGVKLNFFFLSFFNHENYSIKNICVCSKSKIKTKETKNKI